MTDEGEGRSVRRELTIDAPLDAVWKALTDAEELTRWFPLQAEVDPGVGGEVRWKWDDHYDWRTDIEVWEPPRHLRLVYSGPSGEEVDEEGTDAPRPTMAVDFQLEGRSGKTVLRLVHSGFREGADWDDEYEGVRRGWAFELDQLRHYLEGYRGRDRHAAWTVQTIDMPLMEACERLVGPGALALKPGLEALTPGDAVSVQLPDGPRVSGKVAIVDPPSQIAATLAEPEGGLFRVQVERYQGRSMAAVWLSGYAPDAGSFRRWQRGLESLLAELF